MASILPLLGDGGPFVAVEVVALRKHIGRLEQSLMRSLDVLDEIVGNLNAKFGPDFCGNRASQMFSAISEPSAIAMVDEIDGLIKKNQNPAILRKIREDFGVTWDGAQAALSTWSSLSREQKVQVVRVARWMRAVSPAQ